MSVDSNTKRASIPSLHSGRGSRRRWLFPCFLLASLALARCDPSSDGSNETTGGQAGAAGHGGTPSAGQAGEAGTAGHSGDTGDQGGAPSQGGGPGGDAGSPAGGQGNGGSAAGGEGGATGEPPLPLAFEGRFVKKARLRADGSLLVLLERPVALHVGFGMPDRSLVFYRANGERLVGVGSSEDEYLLDFALHPSGEVSALFASQQGYRLARFDAEGTLLADADLTDNELDSDPPALVNQPPSPPIGNYTFDTGRLAAAEEQLLVAARSGRNSVLLYRFDFAERRFERRTRTLIVPPIGLYGVGLTGGSYDTFSQLEAAFSVHLARDEHGITYVAVQHPHNGELNLVKAHEKVFGEKLEGDPDALDLYVTRVNEQGERLGTTVVGTPELDELYGLRAGSAEAYVLGRKEYWNEQGTGFDALIGRVEGSTGAASVSELDVDRADLAFDALPLEDGSLLVTGASGYSQNPHGASISEESQAFVYRLGDGAPEAYKVPNGPRHNEGRSLLSLGRGRWALGGMLDGPGTHSADGDDSKLRADGFLSEL